MDPGSGPAALSCPTPNTTIQCFIFASFGQVAGGPDACTDTCSTEMLTGESSCCAKACTASDGFLPATGASSSVDAAKCEDNSWVTGTTEDCGTESSGGYCDCCPDCYSCVHGDPPAGDVAEDKNSSGSARAEQKPRQRLLVDNRFCDCRSGLDVAPDYAPCWNSCLDCLGDDGEVSYMPSDVAASCIGQAHCYLYATQDGQDGTWFSCGNSTASSCTASDIVKVPDESKVKAAALCG